MPQDRAPLLLSDAASRRALRRRLLAWYGKHERSLPWRESRDPYRVLVSEIMLQQTQVATVERYFLRFIDELPTIRHLAGADEQQVLRLWEGLGYYRRARALHAAARQVVEQHGGEVPREVDSLMRLPGVGRYTAGAIASIAFDQRAPILEANTIRLFSRLLGYQEDPAKAAGQRLLWRFAEEILPRTGIARFNQALMEIGSLVCTPESPRCQECPAADHCEAARRGAQSAIPVASRKVPAIDVREAAVVVRKRGEVLVRQCPERQRWSGLWDFPRFEVDAEGPLLASEEIVRKLREQTGISVDSAALLQTIKHGVTRYRITLDCYEAEFIGGRVRSTAERPVRWLARKKLGELPLSTTGRRIARMIC